jgi:hypothetical protein
MNQELSKIDNEFKKPDITYECEGLINREEVIINN